MKKVVLFFISFFILANSINASEKLEVTLDKCVDGDTAWFFLNGKQIKTRFLAIDTPESTTKVEAYGKEASAYVCNKLNNAQNIAIEYDTESDKFDKYERHLVWVFIDDILIQKDILEQGLAKIDYIYGDYKYLESLYDSEELAKKQKLGIWSNYKEKSKLFDYILVGVGAIVIIIFSKKGRQKIGKKGGQYAKKMFKKSLNNLMK